MRHIRAMATRPHVGPTVVQGRPMLERYCDVQRRGVRRATQRESSERHASRRARVQWTSSRLRPVNNFRRTHDPKRVCAVKPAECPIRHSSVNSEEPRPGVLAKGRPTCSHAAGRSPETCRDLHPMNGVPPLDGLPIREADCRTNAFSDEEEGARRKARIASRVREGQVITRLTVR